MRNKSAKLFPYAMFAGDFCSFRNRRNEQNRRRMLEI